MDISKTDSHERIFKENGNEITRKKGFNLNSFKALGLGNYKEALLFLFE